MSRTGLFGGTFDPIHSGHLVAAEKVKKAHALEKVVFIPSSHPPHKEGTRVAPARDRLAMLRLALNGRDGFSISDCEIRRPGPSYTVDTVRHFLEASPANTRLYLIMGHDAFMEMHTWRSFRKILEQIALIVMERPGVGPVVDETWGAGPLHAYVTSILSPGYRFSKTLHCYQHPELKPIHFFKEKLLTLSSTQIRRCVQDGKSLRGLVPDPVAVYIVEKKLYG